MFWMIPDAHRLSSIRGHEEVAPSNDAMSTFSVKNLRLSAVSATPKREGKKGEYTHYVDAVSFRKFLDQAVAPKNAREIKEVDESSSFDFEGSMVLSGKGDPIHGRGHAALCFGGRKFSVTIRSEGIDKVILVGVQPESSLPTNQIYTSNRVLYDALTNSQSSSETPITKKGLVLIAGGTGAGKTDALNSILTLHLTARLKQATQTPWDRIPHVVVIGDPVETLFFCDKEKSIEASCLEQDTKANRPIDFTPRILGCDVASVRVALDDALRETPEVVVVSELRTRTDFRAALNFAATGHLIIATCHSGSLVEVFGRLLEESGSENSASDRAALVHRLAAVIHIERMGDLLRVPVLWRPSARGQQDFVSEGISSIIPATPTDDGGHDKGVLGHYWMLQRMRRTLNEIVSPSEANKKEKHEIEKYIDYAFAKDLKGM